MRENNDEIYQRKLNNCQKYCKTLRCICNFERAAFSLVASLLFAGIPEEPLLIFPYPVMTSQNEGCEERAAIHIR